jgi:LAGLIDADG DNA endonuclease family protein
MSDGSVSRHGLLICTDSFTIPDIVRLINVLIIKYQLDCKIRYHTPTQPRIYISQKSMDLLNQIVIPYTHPSMKYKLGIKK